jgi:hypothetical protein
MQCEWGGFSVQKFMTDWQEGSSVYSSLIVHNDLTEKRCNMNMIVKSQS